MSTATITKRRPGRPRKNPEATAVPDTAALQAEFVAATTEPEVTATTDAAPAKRRPGRPKGSKNKPKVTAPDASTATPAKRGPGRPKGSKNKPKVTGAETTTTETTAPAAEATATVTADTAAPAKRRPGRPKGSKNKPKVISPEAATAAPAKRGPGRPKGSKNKPKVATPEAATMTPAKRGPGRPKGSKNKPKATTPDASTQVKRGPGRPRKNPEATVTPSRMQKSGDTRQVLANPFKAGDTVTIPAGAVFTSSAPTAKGRQITKRGHSVTVHDFIPARVQPRKSEKGSNVLVRPPRIRAKGSGGYWKDITLTEKIVKLNGKPLNYESISTQLSDQTA